MLLYFFLLLVIRSNISAATPSDQIPLSCSFILDWEYLGIAPLTDAMNTAYLKQREFARTVGDKLFARSDIMFTGNFGFHGDNPLNNGETIADIGGQDDEYAGRNSFNFYGNSYFPNDRSPLSLCDALESLQDNFRSNMKVPHSLGCLVFFSAQTSSDFLKCNSSALAAVNRYKFTVGATLNGECGVIEIANHVIPVLQFDEQNANLMANFIIDIFFDQLTKTTYVESTVETTTVPVPVPLSCSFILDWEYLGTPSQGGATANYTQQRDFAKNVGDKLFARQDIIFTGNFGFHGYEPSEVTGFCIDDIGGAGDVYANKNSFDFSANGYVPDDDSFLSLCDSVESFQSGFRHNIKDPNSLGCLVFFSAQTAADYAACPTIDPRYKFTIGAALNGENGVATIANNTVLISAFDDTNADDLIAAIVTTFFGQLQA